MRKITILLIAATLAFAGCGGGGGNVRPSDDDMDSGTPPTSSLTVDQAQKAIAKEGFQAAQQAAQNTPRFGSVTQSTNRDGAGVTTDQASTRFSPGPRLVVDIARRNGGTLSLDTDQHTVAYDLDTSAVTGREFAQAVVLKHSASELTLGLVATDWSSDDSTDYLAGGYWVHATGDIYAGNVTHAEMGAFVDGPELRGTPDMPTLGTATYNGITAGLYAARYGTDTAVPQGTHEIGEFSGNLALTADFAAGNISGAVNNVSLSYVTETPSGDIYTGLNEASYYRLNLGTTPFDSNGTFTGTDVTLTHPLLSIRSEGSWGGQFSTRDDSAGNPRLVAGTLGGTGTTPGGSTASFVGAFYGATSQFE